MKLKKKIIGIMAATESGVVGINNELPWYYPAELEHFRDTTNKQIIITGRKTFEHLPQNIIASREVILLSKNLNYNKNYDSNIHLTHSIEECIEYLNKIETNKKIYMIGGGEIADIFLKNNLISEFLLTKIHNEYNGDKYLNLEYFKNWEKTILFSCNDYTIVRMINPNSFNFEG